MEVKTTDEPAPKQKSSKDLEAMFKDKDEMEMEEEDFQQLVADGHISLEDSAKFPDGSEMKIKDFLKTLGDEDDEKHFIDNTKEKQVTHMMHKNDKAGEGIDLLKMKNTLTFFMDKEIMGIELEEAEKQSMKRAKDIVKKADPEWWDDRGQIKEHLNEFKHLKMIKN